MIRVLQISFRDISNSVDQLGNMMTVGSFTFKHSKEVQLSKIYMLVVLKLKKLKPIRKVYVTNLISSHKCQKPFGIKLILQ